MLTISRRHNRAVMHHNTTIKDRRYHAPSHQPQFQRIKGLQELVLNSFPGGLVLYLHASECFRYTPIPATAFPAYLYS